MTTNEYMELLSKTDEEYDTVEEKNYQLVHKMMEILPSISDEQLEQIKEEITNKYPYKQYSSFLEYVCVASKTDSAVADISNGTATPLDSRSYTNIIDFYDDYDENLIRYIKGHLFLEFAINTILEKATQKTASKYTFSKKIDLLFDGNFINENEKNLLKRINYFRNRIAHRLDYSKKFRQEHEEEILLHQAAKNAFDDMGVKKLPKVKELQAEYTRLLEEKKKTYAEYRRSREEMRELLAAKANVDRLLNMEVEHDTEREKDHEQR